MVDNSAIAEFIESADSNKEVQILATKAELIAEEEKMVKFQAFNSSYFCGKSHFQDDGTQNYSVLQSIYIYLKRLAILCIFQHGNLKDYLMKALGLLLHLITVLLHH